MLKDNILKDSIKATQRFLEALNHFYSFEFIMRLLIVVVDFTCSLNSSKFAFSLSVSFLQGPPDRLAACVLKEIPEQVIDFYNDFMKIPPMNLHQYAPPPTY